MAVLAVKLLKQNVLQVVKRLQRWLLVQESDWECWHSNHKNWIVRPLEAIWNEKDNWFEPRKPFYNCTLPRKKSDSNPLDLMDKHTHKIPSPWAPVGAKNRIPLTCILTTLYWRSLDTVRSSLCFIYVILVYVSLFPHQWGVLESRLSHSLSVRMQLRDRVLKKM